jgi:L-ascorbate metabolism protein UlaG (beta-lactamase superfamily)
LASLQHVGDAVRQLRACTVQETHADTMVPIEQRVAVLDPAPLRWQDAQQVCLRSAADQ